MALFAAGGAILGHLFPVWLRFRGGKGVATALGALLALAWPVGIAACATWLVVAALFRYSSLAALLALAASPLYAWFLADRQLAQFALGLAILVWIRHHENIRRLLTGEESKIGRGSGRR
jgi:glycerol-3-phosphate acyltransferase PlsY